MVQITEESLLMGEISPMLNGHQRKGSPGQGEAPTRVWSRSGECGVCCRRPVQSICNCQNEATSRLVSSSEQHEPVVGVHSVYAVRFGNIPTCTCLLGIFHTWRWTLSDHSLLFQLNVDAHATTWKYTKWVPQINATSNTNNNWDRQRSSSWRKPRTDK
jgi:hypothetical protein